MTDVDELSFSEDGTEPKELTVAEGHEDFVADDEDDGDADDAAGAVTAAAVAAEIAGLHTETANDGQKNCKPAAFGLTKAASGTECGDEHLAGERRGNAGSQASTGGHEADRSAAGGTGATDASGGANRGGTRTVESAAATGDTGAAASGGRTDSGSDKKEKRKRKSKGGKSSRAKRAGHAALGTWKSAQKFRAAAYAGAMRAKTHFTLEQVQRYMTASREHFTVAIVCLCAKYIKERRSAETAGLLMRAIRRGNVMARSGLTVDLDVSPADRIALLASLRKFVERWHRKEKMPAPAFKDGEVPLLDAGFMTRATSSHTFLSKTPEQRADFLRKVRARCAAEHERQSSDAAAHNKLPPAVRRLLLERCRRDTVNEFVTPVAALAVIPFAVDVDDFPSLLNLDFRVLYSSAAEQVDVPQAAMSVRFFGGAGEAAALLTHCALPPLVDKERASAVDPVQFGCRLMDVIGAAHAAHGGEKLHTQAFTVLVEGIVTNSEHARWAEALHHLCGVSVPEGWWPSFYSNSIVSDANGGVCAMRPHRTAGKMDSLFATLQASPVRIPIREPDPLTESERTELLAEDVALTTKDVAKNRDFLAKREAASTQDCTLGTKSGAPKKAASSTPGAAKKSHAKHAALSKDPKKLHERFKRLLARDRVLAAEQAEMPPAREASFGDHWHMLAPGRDSELPEGARAIAAELDAALPARTVDDIARTISVLTIASNTTSAQRAKRPLKGGTSLDAEEPSVAENGEMTLVSEDYTRSEQIFKALNARLRKNNEPAVLAAQVNLEFSYAKSAQLGAEIERDCGVERLSERMRAMMLAVAKHLRKTGSVPTVNRRTLAAQSMRMPAAENQTLAVPEPTGNGTPRATHDAAARSATPKSFVLEVAAAVGPMPGALTDYDEVCEIRDRLLTTGCVTLRDMIRVHAAAASLPGYVRLVLKSEYDRGNMFEPTADHSDLFDTCRQASREGTGLSGYVARAMIMARALGALCTAFTTPGLSCAAMRKLMTAVGDMREPFSPLVAPDQFAHNDYASKLRSETKQLREEFAGTSATAVEED